MEALKQYLNFFRATDIFYVLILILLIRYANRTGKKFIKCASLFDGPKTLPYFGNSLDFILHPEDIANTIIYYSNKYGPRYRLWIGGKLSIVIAGATDAEAVLTGSKSLNRGEDFHSSFGRVFKNSIFTGDGIHWKQSRKIFQPPLRPNVMHNYTKVMNDAARMTVKELQSKAHTCETFDAINYIPSSTFYVASKIFLDLEELAISKEMYPLFRKTIEEFLSDSFFLMFQPQFIRKIRQLTNQKKLQDTSNIMALPYHKLILEGKFNENFSQDASQNKFINCFLNEVFLDEDRKTQVMTFSIGGSETSAVTTCFTLLILGIYQEVQDKVYEEIERIFGDSDRDATIDDVKQMHYMEQVIKEVMRLFPLVPFLFRSPKEDIFLGDCIIPSGTELVVNVLSLHKNPQYFPNPEKFDPGRFSEEKSKDLPKGCYLPFVIGARNCVGKSFAMCEMKILCSTILRKYRLHSDLKIEDIKIGMTYLLGSIDGYKISISERNKT
uniref:Cytochrome P450 3639B2 n=1 Tax=Maconellicoccus hirsutus TaxID=177089 RepID=A0AAT9UTX4_MACHI